jgi:hypothetical protein
VILRVTAVRGLPAGGGRLPVRFQELDDVFDGQALGFGQEPPHEHDGHDGQAGEVEQDPDVLQLLRLQVQEGVDAQSKRPVPVGGPAGADNTGACLAGELYRDRADAARGAVDQDGLACGQAALPHPRADTVMRATWATAVARTPNGVKHHKSRNVPGPFERSRYVPR